jgi:V/A-type H+-transporting ATPase subunit A
LIDLVVAVVARCEELVEAGLPATTVEEADFSPLVRAREDTGPDDAAGVRARLGPMVARLEALS